MCWMIPNDVWKSDGAIFIHCKTKSARSYRPTPFAEFVFGTFKIFKPTK